MCESTDRCRRYKATRKQHDDLHKDACAEFIEAGESGTGAGHSVQSDGNISEVKRRKWSAAAPKGSTT